MNSEELYLQDSLRVVDYLASVAGDARVADARELMECGEIPIGLNFSAWIISDENLFVPAWVIDEIHRLIENVEEERVNLPQDLDAHRS